MTRLKIHMTNTPACTSHVKTPSLYAKFIRYMQDGKTLLSEK